MLIRLLIVLGFLLFIYSIPYKAYSLTLTTPQVFDSRMVALADTILRSQERSFTIYWSGRGGNSRYGVPFMRKLQEAKNQGKYITIIVTGYSASMHALAACSGSNIIRKDTMMFHKGSTKMQGVRVWASNSDFRILAEDCIDKGVLTEHDIRNVEEGKDVSITATGHRYYLQR